MFMGMLPERSRSRACPSPPRGRAACLGLGPAHGYGRPVDVVAVFLASATSRRTSSSGRARPRSRRRLAHGLRLFSPAGGGTAFLSLQSCLRLLSLYSPRRRSASMTGLASRFALPSRSRADMLSLRRRGSARPGPPRPSRAGTRPSWRAQPLRAPAAQAARSPSRAPPARSSQRQTRTKSRRSG